MRVAGLFLGAVFLFSGCNTTTECVSREANCQKDEEVLRQAQEIFESEVSKREAMRSALQDQEEMKKKDNDAFIQDWLNSFLLKDKAYVVSLLLEPDSVFPDGKGGELYTYVMENIFPGHSVANSRITPRESTTWYGGYVATTSEVGGELVTTHTCTPPTVQKIALTLFFDQEGICYRAVVKDSFQAR